MLVLVVNWSNGLHENDAAVESCVSAALPAGATVQRYVTGPPCGSVTVPATVYVVDDHRLWSAGAVIVATGGDPAGGSVRLIVTDAVPVSAGDTELSVTVSVSLRAPVKLNEGVPWQPVSDQDGSRSAVHVSWPQPNASTTLLDPFPLRLMGWLR